MKQNKLSEKAFMAQWRDARRAGFDMKDFSRTVASRQRAASELQMHATFKGTKKALGEFRKDVKMKRRDFLNDELKNFVTKTNKNISDAEVNTQTRRIKKKGVPQFIRDAAEEKTEKYFTDQKERILATIPDDQYDLYEDMLSAYEMVKKYSGLTYRDFKHNQTKIVRSARTLTEDRDSWDEAFALAFHSPKEKSA